MPSLVQENYQLFVAINRHAGHNALLDGSMVFCATALIFLWPVLLLLLWGLPPLLLPRLPHPQEAQILHACRELALWSVGACLLALAVNVGLSHLVFEPRPFVSHQVHLLITHPADDSFPSDHAAVSFAVAGMFWFTLPTWWVHGWFKLGTASRTLLWPAVLRPALLLVLSVLVAGSIGLARVFVGVHYPGDILAGALSGLLAAGILTLLMRPARPLVEALLRVCVRLRLA
jgi:undecaprenyl-diphosphatase